MKRRYSWIFLTLILASIPVISMAGALEPGEKGYFKDLKAGIPEDRFKSVDELHGKWQEIKAGTSKAVIINVLSRDEFERGYIEGSHNVDITQVYEVPEKWPDPDTEIWVHCRGAHRAIYVGALMYKYGYQNVYVVKGGIAAWQDRGFPMINKYIGEIQVIDGETSKYK